MISLLREHESSASRRLCFVVLILIVAFYQLVRARVDYPIWDGDAAGFWPHVKSYAETRQFNNSVFAPFLEWQTGYAQAANTYSHGFLTPMLLAWCSGGDYHRLHLVIALMHVISTACLLCGLNRVLPSHGPAWIKWMVRAVVVLIFNWSCFDPSRPECVTCLPICLYLAAWAGREIRGPLVFCLGTGCAVVFWSNPAPGLLTACLSVVLLLTQKESVGVKLKRCGNFLVTTALVACLLFALMYPGDWREFARGFYQVGKFNLAISEWRLFASWFVRKVEYPLLALPLAVGCLLMLAQAWRNVRAGADVWLAGLSAVVLLTACWTLGVRAPFRSYVFLPLLPVVLIVLASRACAWFNHPRAGVGGRLAAAALVLPGLANAAMIASDWVRFDACLSHGVRLQTTTDWIASVREKAPGARIGVSGALFVCVEHDRACALFHPQAPRNEDFLFVQQVNTGRLEPAEISGYELIGHSFVSHQPRLPGRAGRITPGYSAALYKKKVS